MFNAYLYGIEAWWGIDAFNKQLLLLERKLLKIILGVKRNTPDDLLYLEIDRPDIMAVIKWRQYSFFKRLLSLDEEEAISRKLTSMYSHLPIIRYYEELDKDVIVNNKINRLHLSRQATTTYISRYHNLIDRRFSHIIYDNFIPEKIRIIITKWRLSCHSLRIETGRRDPYILRHLRVCRSCIPPVVEDESHVIYICPLYETLRVNYIYLLQCYARVENILNPYNKEDAISLGNFLLGIERRREELNLVQV